jgi:hypothetical protein
VIYEIRTREADDGKTEAMTDRFNTVAASKVFPRDGIELLIASVAATEDRRLTSVNRFESELARKKAWEALAADLEWAKVKAESEKVSILSRAMFGLVFD